MLSCVEVNPKAAPVASIIWLHGLGADGHDFADIVPQLHLSEALPLRFVFPHAPVQPVTLNGGYPMRSWYDIYGLSIDTQEDEKGIRASAELINALIEQEVEQGIPTDRIVLAGFSQGGAMALYCGLRFPEKLAGILALSTYLPLAGTIQAEGRIANKSIPIFMAHGDNDNVIHISLAQLSLNFLQAANYNVDFKTYPIGHSVCEQEINAISSWLNNLFNK